MLGVIVAHALTSRSFTLYPSFVEFAVKLSWEILVAAFVGSDALAGCEVQLIRASISQSAVFILVKQRSVKRFGRGVALRRWRHWSGFGG
jgi:hypothetical protein